MTDRRIQAQPEPLTLVDTSAHNQSRSIVDAGKPVYVPVRDFCALSGLAPSTAYELCAAGALPGVLRIGRRILIHREIALAHLEQLARTGGEL